MELLNLYLKKGSVYDPENYRAITLISCLGKVFTAILNARLNEYAERVHLITRSQAGFRKGYSTQDNMFILHCLITLYFSKKKKLFCSFIDFSRAFDTVWRKGLFTKLELNYVHGKFLNIVKSMYNNIKSCVEVNNNLSDYFACNIGVRQGENLSPFLFSIYLNDLEQFFIECNVSSLQTVGQISSEKINTFLQIFLLFYADDTCVFAESKEDMQRALNSLNYIVTGGN